MIRSNILLNEESIESSAGNIARSLSGVGQTNTSIIPDGEGIEPQIQGTGSVYDDDIANTPGVIPDEYLSDAQTRDRLVSKQESMKSLNLSSIIDENKLNQYIYQQLVGKPMNEAPEPKPTLENDMEFKNSSSSNSSSSFDTTDKELDKAIKDAIKNNKAPKMESYNYSAPEPKPSFTESSIDMTDPFNRLVYKIGMFMESLNSSQYEAPEPTDWKIYESRIDDLFEMQFRPIMESIAKVDSTGAVLERAAERLLKTKKAIKQAIKSKIKKKNLECTGPANPGIRNNLATL